MEKSYSKHKFDILSKLWREDSHSLRCPECGNPLVLIQAEPIEDYENPYTAYDTVIECTSCSFTTRAESFTILGSVKDFSVDRVEIGGWSPTGSRVVSTYEHLLDYNTLSKLKRSGELVEFLIIDGHVIQIIGG